MSQWLVGFDILLKLCMIIKYEEIIIILVFILEKVLYCEQFDEKYCWLIVCFFFVCFLKYELEEIILFLEFFNYVLMRLDVVKLFFIFFFEYIV